MSAQPVENALNSYIVNNFLLNFYLCFCFKGTAPPPPHPDAIGSLDVFSLAAAATATGGASGGTPLTAAPAYKEKGASSHMLIFTSSGGGTKQQQQQQGEGGEEAAPLFYQPGKRGFYTPRQGS